MGRWVVSVLGLEPLHLKGNSHLAGARAAGMTRRFWAAARSADAARPGAPRCECPGNDGRRPHAQSSAEAPGPTCGCGNGVMALDLQRPLDGSAPPRSMLEAHHRTAFGPAADQPETSRHYGDSHMVQTLQVRTHDTVLAPHRRPGPGRSGLSPAPAWSRTPRPRGFRQPGTAPGRGPGILAGTTPGR